jgi:hypothetical protein
MKKLYCIEIVLTKKKPFHSIELIWIILTLIYIYKYIYIHVQDEITNKAAWIIKWSQLKVCRIHVWLFDCHGNGMSDALHKKPLRFNQ